MATWDRFDICEAYCVIEWDYNLGGWLRERPTNCRRHRSTAVQLFRMKFKPKSNLSYETLTDNGKEIYEMLIEGYYGLKASDRVQAGDIQKMNDDWYCEYPANGLLIGKFRGEGGTWYRKESPMPDAPS